MYNLRRLCRRPICIAVILLPFCSIFCFGQDVRIGLYVLFIIVIKPSEMKTHLLWDVYLIVEHKSLTIDHVTLITLLFSIPSHQIGNDNTPYNYVIVERKWLTNNCPTSMKMRARECALLSGCKDLSRRCCHSHHQRTAHLWHTKVRRKRLLHLRVRHVRSEILFKNVPCA